MLWKTPHNRNALWKMRYMNKNLRLYLLYVDVYRHAYVCVSTGGIGRNDIGGIGVIDGNGIGGIGGIGGVSVGVTGDCNLGVVDVSRCRYRRTDARTCTEATYHLFHLYHQCHYHLCHLYLYTHRHAHTHLGISTHSRCSFRQTLAIARKYARRAQGTFVYIAHFHIAFLSCSAF